MLLTDVLHEDRRMLASVASRQIRRYISPQGRRWSAAGLSQRRGPHNGLQLQPVRRYQADEVRRRGMAPAQAFQFSGIVVSLQFSYGMCI